MLVPVTMGNCARMKKTQFLLSVFLGALQRDIQNETNKAQSILLIANRIPEEAIPPMVENAAEVFLAFCHGVTDSEFKWMFQREPVPPPTVPAEIIPLESSGIPLALAA